MDKKLTVLDTIVDSFKETCTKEEIEYFEETLKNLEKLGSDKQYILGVKCGMVGAMSFCKNHKQTE